MPPKRVLKKLFLTFRFKMFHLKLLDKKTNLDLQRGVHGAGMSFSRAGKKVHKAGYETVLLLRPMV